MKAYIVRHIATKEFQGVFWGTRAEVWQIFDELGDPYGFEFASIGPGAIFTHAPVGTGQQLREDIDFSGFNPSETLAIALDDPSSLRWVPFDPSDKGVGLLSRIINK